MAVGNPVIEILVQTGYRLVSCRTLGHCMLHNEGGSSGIAYIPADWPAKTVPSPRTGRMSSAVSLDTVSGEAYLIDPKTLSTIGRAVSSPDGSTHVEFYRPYRGSWVLVSEKRRIDEAVLLAKLVARLCKPRIIHAVRLHTMILPSSSLLARQASLLFRLMAVDGLFEDICRLTLVH